MNITKNPIIKIIPRYPVFFYFIVTFLFSWVCWFIAFTDKNDPSILDQSWLIAQIGVFSPSIMAIIFTFILKGKKFFRRFSELFSIYLLLIIIGILISRYQVKDLNILPPWLSGCVIFIAIIIFVYLLYQHKILYTEQNHQISKRKLFSFISSSWLFYPLLFLIIWIFIHIFTGNASVGRIQNLNLNSLTLIVLLVCFDFIYGGAIGEEIGWRGYALPQLLKKYNPLVASLILGIIWSLWHLPIDLAAGFGVKGLAGAILRIFMVCPMSIIITWFYIHSGFGLVTSVLLHAGINIMPAFEFSNYEAVFGLLILVQLIICIIILTRDKSFKVMYIKAAK